MEIERIYYRLWEKPIQRMRMEKAEFSINVGIPLSFDTLCTINIESNNNLFIEELETIIPKGFGYCNNWLSGLIADYVKRCSRENGDTPYLLEYYTNWLNNTMLILNGKYPFIDEWCKEYREWIIDYLQKESSHNHPQQEKSNNKKKLSKPSESPIEESLFSGLVQHKDKEVLLEKLHSLIGSKKGIDAAAIIVRATEIDKYLLRYPKQREYESEFGEFQGTPREIKSQWEAIRKNFGEPDNNMMDRLRNVIIFN